MFVVEAILNLDGQTGSCLEKTKLIGHGFPLPKKVRFNKLPYIEFVYRLEKRAKNVSDSPIKKQTSGMASYTWRLNGIWFNNSLCWNEQYQKRYLLECNYSSSCSYPPITELSVDKNLSNQL